MQAGQIHDDYRIDFISEHLKWLHKGISEGCHCLGYHMWTFIDNWSWLNGYKKSLWFCTTGFSHPNAHGEKKAENGLPLPQNITVLIKRLL